MAFRQKNTHETLFALKANEQQQEIVHEGSHDTCCTILDSNQGGKGEHKSQEGTKTNTHISTYIVNTRRETFETKHKHTYEHFNGKWDAHS